MTLPGSEALVLFHHTHDVEYRILNSPFPSPFFKYSYAQSYPHRWNDASTQSHNWAKIPIPNLISTPSSNSNSHDQEPRPQTGSHSTASSHPRSRPLPHHSLARARSHPLASDAVPAPPPHIAAAAHLPLHSPQCPQLLWDSVPCVAVWTYSPHLLPARVLVAPTVLGPRSSARSRRGR